VTPRRWVSMHPRQKGYLADDPPPLGTKWLGPACDADHRYEQAQGTVTTVAFRDSHPCLSQGASVGSCPAAFSTVKAPVRHFPGKFAKVQYQENIVSTVAHVGMPLRRKYNDKRHGMASAIAICTGRRHTGFTRSTKTVEA